MWWRALFLLWILATPAAGQDQQPTPTEADCEKSSKSLILGILAAEKHRLYAGANGALICGDPDQLRVYYELRNDEEAKRKYLASPDASACAKQPQDTAYEWLKSDNDQNAIAAIIAMIVLDGTPRTANVILKVRPVGGENKNLFALSTELELWKSEDRKKVAQVHAQCRGMR
jgi:hypothetical protein